ncbi:MAG: four helix bundle protein [Bacteroidetes bacterium HGW-Bacteroidetes-12]|nr:MAG: four helix bundle protein [Bacteroidetes bacterium HGW-Bacteroidetes-12]
MSFNFEKLIVWQDAVELTGKIHELTLTFPKEELYVLTSQTKRAADSIALNIAEGSTGQSKKEFKRFLGFALRSGIEIISCLYVARRRKLINEVIFEDFYKTTEQLIIKIQALRKSLRDE